MNWRKIKPKLFSAKGITLSLFSVFMLIITINQNCAGKGSPANFSVTLDSLQSMAGGESYDGKPTAGNYCRIFDELSCQSQVEGLQSLLKVDSSGLHLVQDNCATTLTNFLYDDGAVTYASLLSDYVGLSRGIFKKCEVEANELPKAPTEMSEAYCVSGDKNFAAVINKNLKTAQLDLALAFNSPNGVRRVVASDLNKRVSSSEIIFTSLNSDFQLTISRSNTQTHSGRMTATVDNAKLEKAFDCRTSSPLPTVIVASDLELSSTWIDTGELVGYWKLNEVNATEGSSIKDSSRFGAAGLLATGSDGQIKSDTSVKDGAMMLDGVDDKVTVLRPLDNHLEFGTRSFSFMVWIKKTGSTSMFDMPIFHGGSSPNSAGYEIECGNNRCRACISDGLDVRTIPGSANCSYFLSGGGDQLVNRWVLLSAVVDRSNQELRTYLDGILYSSVSIASIGSVNSSVDLIFGMNDMSIYRFVGSIDDVAIWNRALSSAEVLQTFQRMRPKFY